MIISMKARFIIILFSVLYLSGCPVIPDPLTIIEGSGVPGELIVDINNVNDIQIHGTATVLISIGSTESVKITGDENILDHLVAEQTGSSFISHAEINHGFAEMREGKLTRVVLTF